MARSDLQALFHSNDRGLRAVEIFTNRESEWEAVLDSIRHISAHTGDAAFDPQDIESPRRNVLVFYGVGGIGKTTLSRHIHNQLTGSNPVCQWNNPEKPFPRVVSARLDLSRQTGMDFESLVLAIRLAVAPLGAMPAFDLAFRRFWECRHPNESLDEYLRSHTFLRQFGASLPRQIEEALADVSQVLGLPGLLGKLTGQGLAAVVRLVRDRSQRSRALACGRLPDLLEATPDLDSLSYYPHLLSWDLAQLPSKRAAVPVILLDTFEDITSNPDRYLEQLVQRVMWLLPNVLFVVTGRNRLTWDDARLAGQLDWAGARCWPSLTPSAYTEPTQHLIGYLSATDCEEYLAHRLTKDESPLIPADIRDTIAARSGGLPLYLDLAVLRFLTVYRDNGTVPTVDEFDADFSALVTRTFRDLGPDERHILRAVSLLDGFSVHLATDTAGFLRDSAALRLIERPFVENDPSGIWPHRLHELIRDAIREADSTSPDRWSSRDWRSAAARAHRALGREASREAVSSAKFVACLSQSLRLARDFDLDLDWLTPATFRYVEDAIWQPINVSAGGNHNSASALIDTLTVITARNHRHRARTADELTAILSAELLPDDLTELPEYYLAMCHRDLGRFDDSIAGMRRVARRGGHLAGEATRGLLHLSRRLGNFTEALELTQHLGPEDKRQRALGELWWSHGQIVLACTSLDRARRDAIARGWSGEAALCQTYLAFVSAFADRPSALEHIYHATHMLADTPVGFAEILLQVAQLITDAGYDPQLLHRANTIVSQANSSGLTSLAAYARLAACFHAAVLENPQQIVKTRTHLAACVSGKEFAYLVELSHMFTQTAPDPDWPRATWIGGAPATRERWHHIVLDRRNSLHVEGN